MTADVTQVSVVGDITVIGVSGSVTAPVIAVNVTATPVIETTTTTIPPITVSVGVQGPPGPAGNIGLPSQISNGGKYLTTDGNGNLSWSTVTSGINLNNLSVVTASPGAQGLSYNNTTGVFTFTPSNAITTFSVTTASPGTQGLGYNSGTGVFTFTPADLTGYVSSSTMNSAISIAINNLINSAPSTLDTLGEIATLLQTDTTAIGAITTTLAGKIGLTNLSVTTNAASGGGSLSYNNTTGAFTFTPPNLSSYLTGITNLQITNALGFTPYNAINPSNYITTSALSVTTNSASGSGSLSYNAGVFTFTPPVIPSVPTYTVTTGSASGGGSLSLTGTTFTFNPASIPTVPTYTVSTAAASGGGSLSLTGSTFTFTPPSLSSYITTSSLSVTTNAASGGGSLSYTGGVFTFTPPNLSSYLTGITSGQVTTALGFTPIQSSSLSVTTNSASGSGSLSYSSGVFTFTPPVIPSVPTYTITTGSASGGGSLSLAGSTFTFNPAVQYTLTSLGIQTALGSNLTANTVYAAPNGTTGSASFRALVAADIPALAYSTLTGTPTLATVATSGSYNDLSNKPSIPSVPTYTITTGSASGGGSLSLTGTTFTFNPATIGIFTKGDPNPSFSQAQLTFGYNGTTNYPHFVHTTHNAGAAAINAIHFYTSDGTQNGVFPTNGVLGLTVSNGSISVPTSVIFGDSSVQTTAWTGVSSITWPVANTNGASGPTKIAIGTNAGATSQGVNTVAIGNSAGNTSQGGASVSIGFGAGNSGQGNSAIAIGLNAGSSSQGAYSIAIGSGAGSALTNAQAARTIILNASGSDFDGVASQTDSFYVAPIRTDATPSNVLYYNTTTKEVTYGTAPVNYTLPTATTSVLGGVKVDGTTITITNGVISGSSSYSLPTASTTVLGGVKVDGSTITISGGVISSTGGGTTLPSQSGNNGKYLTTDGSTLSWATVAGGGSGATLANDTTDTVLYPTMSTSQSGSFTTANTNAGLTYNATTSLLSIATETINGTGMNLIYPSQGFSATYWTVSALTVTANSILAPDGTTTGATFTGSGASGGHSIYGIATYTAAGFLNSTNLSRTISCYFQKGTSNFVQLAVNSSDVTVYANYDLNNGVLGTVGAGCTATITAVPNYAGWYRCTMTWTAATISNVYMFLISTATAVRAESNTLSTTIYAWGMQCEYGPTARTYQATTNAYVYGTPALQINNNNILSLDTTGNLSFGGNLLTTTIGSLSTTVNIANGLTSTSTQSVGIATGTNSGTKTINIGTGGGGANITLGAVVSGTTIINSSTVQGAATTQTLYNTVATTLNFAGAAQALYIGSTASGSTTVLNAPTVIGSATTQNLYNTVATTVNEFGLATTINVAANAAGATTWTLGNSANSNTLTIAGGTTSGTDSISTTITNGTVNVLTGVVTGGTINIGGAGSNTVVGGILTTSTSTTTNAVNITYTPATALGAAIQATGKDTIGGTGYFDFFKATNTTSGVTNANKTLRLTSTGNFQLINSAYTSTLLDIDDSGNTIVAGNLTINGVNAGYAPNRPAFRVVGNGGAITATTTVTSSNWTLDYQQGSALNTTTGIFTAPVAGLYMVTLVIRTNSNTGSLSQAIVRKTAAIGGAVTSQIMVEFAANTTMNHAGGSTIVKLALNDTLKLDVTQGTLSFDGNDNWSVAYLG